MLVNCSRARLAQHQFQTAKWESAMGCLKTRMDGKKVFLLGLRAEMKSGKGHKIEAREQLLEVMRRNPDAVAFGFVSGRWVAAA
jgi:hypothetical protein